MSSQRWYRVGTKEEDGAREPTKNKAARGSGKLCMVITTIWGAKGKKGKKLKPS